MGEALIKGLYAKHSVHVCETNAQRVKYLKGKYKGIVLGDLKVVEAASVIVLAVKPQDMEQVLKQVSVGNNKLFISIAAGLTTKFFEKHLGGKVKVVRAMPNMPALIGEGMTAICKGRFATTIDINEAAQILESIGAVLEVQEKYMDVITAVSGSGPAYVFLFIEQWIAAARVLGLSEKDAEFLVYKTLIGSTHLWDKTGFTASDLRAKVTSKGGTTQAAMDVFLKDNIFGKLMKVGMAAAKKRAKELAK